MSTYFNKVLSRFRSSNNDVFVAFQDLLKGFDPSKQTPIDLYRNIEKLFGEENNDLIEEFLLFLTPGQAAEVGKFMDHLMMNKMTQFLHLLKVY